MNRAACGHLHGQQTTPNHCRYSQELFHKRPKEHAPCHRDTSDNIIRLNPLADFYN
jgi:hypothetical protein